MEKQKNRKTVGWSEEVEQELEEKKKNIDENQVRSASEVAEMRVKRSTMHKEELLNQPRVSFWIEKLDDLLEDSEGSELNFDDLNLNGDSSPG